MKPHPTTGTNPQSQARSLLAEIQGSPDTILPRREALVEWLDAFLLRAGRRGYVLEPTEAADLIALDGFLRDHSVPAAVQSVR